MQRTIDCIDNLAAIDWATVDVGASLNALGSSNGAVEFTMAFGLRQTLIIDSSTIRGPAWVRVNICFVH